MIIAELTAEEWLPSPRGTEVLGHLGVATSSWYRPESPERKRPGPAPKPIPLGVVDVLLMMVTDNPWYGSKRIAVMGRRAGHAVKDRVVYLVMRQPHLLHRRRSRAAEV
jgi:putative transposase